jgi:hypothetical protein
LAYALQAFTTLYPCFILTFTTLYLRFIYALTTLEAGLLNPISAAFTRGIVPERQPVAFALEKDKNMFDVAGRLVALAP